MSLIHQGRFKTLIKQAIKKDNLFVADTNQGTFIHSGAWGINKDLITNSETKKLVRQGYRKGLDIGAIIEEHGFVPARKTPFMVENGSTLRLIQAGAKLVCFDEKFIRAFNGLDKFTLQVQAERFDVLNIMLGHTVAGFIFRVCPSQDIQEEFDVIGKECSILRW